MRFTADELIFAALVFLPVCHNHHWSLYCINRYHNQIDILDPLDWAQKEDQDRYHAAICGPIQERLNELLYVFTNGVFPAIGQWDMPYVPVPKQKIRSNDCVFFCMLYMENYKGSTREMDISFESLKGNEIRAQFLHYLIFHKQNKAPHPFPIFIEVMDSEG
ncbi:hypothetical protein GQ55_2G212100 [Panicum hallii var. hallii]|uniref:Ubiquitin-like protease family profile domain-containing protein n=1 Tax=Panicum hallii var. hallii TaxID=1504633 RepID=A0A2T7EQZ2_9POAL|nr:hypothetical protein GQ55_2G212100 [Panicum hallii var. hallii]